MKISMIAAATENNVIGKDGEMPWHISNDLKYFMRTTRRHHIVMGRKTFEETFGEEKPLRRRTNIVLSRQENLTYKKGVIVVDKLEKALEIGRKNGEKELFLIGGEQIYRLGMPFADKIYLTRIHTELEGDTFFPIIDKNAWSLTNSETIEDDPKSLYAYTFQIWERR
ncbi:MAG: dihydrofolate reductase [Chitinophagales bacterium]